MPMVTQRNNLQVMTVQLYQSLISGWMLKVSSMTLQCYFEGINTVWTEYNIFMNISLTKKFKVLGHGFSLAC